MKILFYEKVEKRPSGKGGWIHAFELLNNLSRLGHSIVWADGQSYSPVEQFDIGLDSGQRQSLWERTKVFGITLPLRSEAMFLWYLLKEVRLFFVAFGTTLRHKPDVIYRRHSIFNTECIPAKLFKVPLIKEVNGILVDEVKISGPAGRFSLRIIDRIERLNLRQADKIIVVTSKLKELLCNDYKILEDKIFVIENGANTDLFQPMDTIEARAKLGLSQNNSYICFVGTLMRWQGVEYLIKSTPPILGEYSNTRVFIIGDGPIKDELIELAEQLGVSDNVVFVGTVPYGQVPLYIAASDVCVVPKKPMAGGYSPLKLCEYMACEKPVVATRTAGFEILEANNAGLLVNPESLQEFAEVIIKLLHNPELRKQMGENGRKYVVKNRSWQSVAKRVAEVCEQAFREQRKEQTKRKL